MTPEFGRRLRRAVALYVREMRDGCVDCIALNRKFRGGVMCPACSKVAADVATNPRKYVTVRPDDPCPSSGPRPTG